MKNRFKIFGLALFLAAASCSDDERIVVIVSGVSRL